MQRSKQVAFFFPSPCFRKEIENMFSVFLYGYRNTRKILKEFENSVKTQLPQHFSFSQTSSQTSSTNWIGTTCPYCLSRGYIGFRSIKHLRVFLIPSPCDVSVSPIISPAVNLFASIHLCTSVERNLSVLNKNSIKWPGRDSNPDSQSGVPHTTRPMRLPHLVEFGVYLGVITFFVLWLLLGLGFIMLNSLFFFKCCRFLHRGWAGIWSY